MLQIQQLDAEIKGSYGLKIGDAIRKAVMFGRGEIASHVYYNDGVTWAKLVRLSPSQLKELNDPVHLFDIRIGRGRVLQVRSDRLSDKQSQLLISRWPKVRVLPAHKQDDPRPKLIPHTYYRLIHVEPDTSVRGTVLCVFRQGNSEFKARLHKCDLAQIAAAMPTKRVGSLRAKSS